MKLFEVVKVEPPGERFVFHFVQRVQPVDTPQLPFRVTERCFSNVAFGESDNSHVGCFQG